MTPADAFTLGKEAARLGVSLAGNPWLRVAMQGRLKDAWNRGWDEYHQPKHPQIDLFRGEPFTPHEEATP